MTRYVSLTLFFLMIAPYAGAQENAEPAGYRELVEQALSEYGAKNYEEASTLFERAHSLHPSARTLRGLGMATFELRRYDESVRYLEAALASQEKPLEAGLRSETEALLARARGFVVTVEVRVVPKEASVTLDGEAVPSLDAPLLVPIGPHTLEARATGYGPVRRELRVRGGDSLKVELALPPLVAESPEPEERSERALRKNPWLWSGVAAVVVAAAVTGIVLATRDEERRTIPGPTANAPSGVALTTRYGVR